MHATHGIMQAHVLTIFKTQTESGRPRCVPSKGKLVGGEHHARTRARAHTLYSLTHTPQWGRLGRVPSGGQLVGGQRLWQQARCCQGLEQLAPQPQQLYDNGWARRAALVWQQQAQRRVQERRQEPACVRGRQEFGVQQGESGACVQKRQARVWGAVGAGAGMPASCGKGWVPK